MEFALLGVLLLVMALFSILNGKAFYQVYNLMNILKAAGSIAIMVLGLTWVIGMSEMDASFPEVASCASMLFAVMLNARVDPMLAAGLCLLAGVGFGLLTSLLVVKLQFHSLITTIATSTIAGAVANILYNGSVLSIKRLNSTALYKFFVGDVLGFPVVFVIAVALYALALLVQEKTRYGQYVYALAENRQAVKETGVKTGRVITATFVLSSFFAAFGGIVYVLTVYKSGQPSMGSSFFLNGFTIVFLGAMALRLGKANVVGTFIGALVLSALTSGLTMLGSGFAVGQVIKGLLLIMGVAVVTAYRRKIVPKGSKMKYE
jgi:ribose transport system permease protein